MRLAMSESLEPAAPPPAAVCTRAIARQGTSAVANPGPLPEDDDPLLGFAPYRHVQPRSNAILPHLQRRFVATLAATGIVQQAARSIGKSMEALYKLKHKPGAEGFAAAWDAALERGVQRLEDCALMRAMQGTPTPIVSGGKLLDWYDKPDNTLLRFLLQHRLTQKYGLQRVQPGHPVYESIRKEVLAEQARQEADEEEEVLASIDRFIDDMRERRLANAELVAMYARPDGDAGDAVDAGGAGTPPVSDGGSAADSRDGQPPCQAGAPSP